MPLAEGSSQGGLSREPAGLGALEGREASGGWIPHSGRSLPDGEPLPALQLHLLWALPTHPRRLAGSLPWTQPEWVATPAHDECDADRRHVGPVTSAAQTPRETWVSVSVTSRCSGFSGRLCSFPGEPLAPLAKGAGEKVSLMVKPPPLSPVPQAPTQLPGGSSHASSCPGPGRPGCLAPHPPAASGKVPGDGSLGDSLCLPGPQALRRGQAGLGHIWNVHTLLSPTPRPRRHAAALPTCRPLPGTSHCGPEPGCVTITAIKSLRHLGAWGWGDVQWDGKSPQKVRP